MRPEKTNRLGGCTVLLTRPEPQAGHLAGLLENAGANAVRLPMIRIEGVSHSPNIQKQFDALSGYHKVIFISANAVDFALPYLAKPGDVPDAVELVAIGRATSHRLAAKIRPADIQPDDAQVFNSENLLRLPVFARLEGQRILLVKGEGGRKLLQTTLARRGAVVDTASVYRRVGLSYPDEMLAEAVSTIDATVATSVELLHALCSLPAPWSERIRALPLVVISKRIATEASTAGFRQVHVANQADDRSIVVALNDALGGCG